MGYSGFDHVEELSPLPGPNLREVQTTARAFAGICKEGSVVTWGNADYGGDSMQVAHQLSYWGQSYVMISDIFFVSRFVGLPFV